MTPVTNFFQVIGFFSPEIILSLGVLMLLVVALFPNPERRRTEICLTTLGILVVAGLLVYFQGAVPFLNGARPGYLDLGNGNKILRADKMAVFFKGFFVGISFLSVLLSWRSKELLGRHYAEFCALILSVTVGMILMATAVDLLMIYLAVEMVSILSYVLAGFMRGSIRSSEASLKYLLYGAFSSGVMIYGMSILYGVSGTTNLIEMKSVLSGSELGSNVAIVASVLFVLAGIGYKMAVVPFHFWCPDVYEGAPLPSTAFFSVGPKAAGFALAIRFFMTGLTEPFTMSGAQIQVPDMPQARVVAGIDWVTALYILSIVTMTLGNLAALRQKNAKRLLAYSSIAHAGYLLMGLTTLTLTGLQSILFYLVVYALMNLGAFYVVMLVADQRGSDELSAFRGTFKDAPWVAVAMCIFLFSLTGLPPLAGFAGKFYLFGAVVEGARTLGSGRLWILVAIGVINSAISLFYYVRVVLAMLAGSLDDEAPGAEAPVLTIPVSSQALLLLFVVPTVVLGMAFGWLKILAEWTFTYAT